MVIASLEAELELKLQQLRLLSAENEALQVQSKALQLVVSSSERHLERLRSHGPPVFDVQPAGAGRGADVCNTSSGTAGQRSSSAATGGLEQLPCLFEMHLVKQMTGQQILARWKDFTAEASQALLDYEAEELQRQLQAEPGGSRASSSASICHSIVGTLCPLHVSPSDIEDARRKCNSPVEQRLLELALTYGCSFQYIVALNPAAFLQVWGTNLSSGQVELPPQGHWAGVMAKVALDPVQVRDLLAAQKLVERSYQRVVAERSALQQQLEQVGLTSRDTMNSLIQLSSSQAAVHDVVQALRANVRREYSLDLLTCEAFWDQLTLLQAIRVVVHSWPYIPDDLQLLNAVRAHEAAGPGEVAASVVPLPRTAQALQCLPS